VPAEVEPFDARVTGGAMLNKETDLVCGLELARART